MKVLLNEHSEQEWNAWLSQQPHTEPLQSWSWKRAQERVGKTVHTVSVVNDDGVVIAQTLAIEEGLGFSRVMLVSPRGPVFVAGVSALLEQDALGRIAAHMKAAVAGAIVWRCEPAVILCATEGGDQRASEDFVLQQQMQLLGAAGGTQVHDKQPAVTRMLDLSASAAELLAAMKQKTRYNIRLSEKKGVTTQWFERTEASPQEWQQLVQAWWVLQQETAGRQGIRVQPQSYFNALLAADWAPKSLYIGVARVGDAIAAMNINIVAGDTMTYLFGASLHTYRDSMAPYGLQWSGIELAKTLGARYYDFYGVAPQRSSTEHRLAGVTRFKEGFGGALYVYPGTWEFPISRLWYRMYRLVQRLRS